jgi:hypothetical protein
VSQVYCSEAAQAPNAASDSAWDLGVDKAVCAASNSRCFRRSAATSFSHCSSRARASAKIGSSATIGTVRQIWGSAFYIRHLLEPVASISHRYSPLENPNCWRVRPPQCVAGRSDIRGPETWLNRPHTPERESDSMPKKSLPVALGGVRYDTNDRRGDGRRLLSVTGVH